MFSNIRLTLYTPWEDLDCWSRSFLFVFSYNHTEDRLTRCFDGTGEGIKRLITILK